MELKGKKVLVFGSGLSGIGAANLLVKVGAEPVIYDENKNRNTEDILKKVENPDQVSVVIGELSEDCLNSLDLVVMSPGVPLDIPAAERFRQKGLPVWGEVELAYQTGKGRILAITGTMERPRPQHSLEKSSVTIMHPHLWLEISEHRTHPWHWNRRKTVLRRWKSAVSSWRRFRISNRM